MEAKPVGEKINCPNERKDLGITVCSNLSWSAHVNAGLKEASRVLYATRRNVAVKVKTFIKPGLYRSLVLPVLLYGMNCVQLTKNDLQNTEKFQRRAVKWITGRPE